MARPPYSLQGVGWGLAAVGERELTCAVAAGGGQGWQVRGHGGREDVEPANVDRVCGLVVNAEDDEGTGWSGPVEDLDSVDSAPLS